MPGDSPDPFGVGFSTGGASPKAACSASPSVSRMYELPLKVTITFFSSGTAVGPTACV